MAPSTPRPNASWIALIVLLLLTAACSDPDIDSEDDPTQSILELPDEPRRYSAEWLIDAEAMAAIDVASPYLYREVVDDQTGSYLVQAPRHLALQRSEEVVFCSAISRLPLDPYCASTPRAEGAPHVLSYPVQLLREWGPAPFYELASYREVSLVANSDTDNWTQWITTSASNFAVECFVVTGETTAATEGFEICFTNDDLHLVASVDLQSDLVYEIDLLSYERFGISDDFETGLEEFYEPRPALQEQLLDLYPEIPAARPTPTPEPPE